MITGPRQLSVDIDKGVIILGVPEKKYQTSLWRFVTHYSGVLKKYFGISQTESDVRTRANSSVGNQAYLKQNSIELRSSGRVIGYVMIIFSFKPDS